MRTWIALLAACVSAAALAGCGDSSSSDTTSTSATRSTSSTPPGAPSEGVRQAARAWSDAYLTGTIDDIVALQGPKCLTGEPLNDENRERAEADLEQLRNALQDALDVSPDDIELRDVAVRNVTETSGQASVQYNLTSPSLSSDNWVTYELADGSWKVSDCMPPIRTQQTPTIQTVPSTTG